MKAGALNRRITIQARDAGFDAAGQPVATWSDFATVWANLRTQTGLGAIRDMQGDLSASVTGYSFRIRYREDITPAMRVSYNGQLFDIKQVQLDYAGRDWTDLVCAVGGSDG